MATHDEPVVVLADFLDPDRNKIPAGTYRCQVIDTELTESSEKTPLLNVWLEVCEGHRVGRQVAVRVRLDERAGATSRSFIQAALLGSASESLPNAALAAIGLYLLVTFDAAGQVCSYIEAT